MKYPTRLVVLFACLVSCERKQPAEVTATEVRGPSTRDGEMVLDATSAQRFGGAQGGGEAVAVSYADVAPESWKQQAASSFRLKNYSFGTAGEVYLSVSSGSVLDNTNRWLGQFTAPKLDEESLSALSTVDFLGTKGFWVAADGTFAGGMGKAAADGYALRGVIASVDGAIVTVKMIGPKAEVEAQEQALRQYAATLKSVE